MASSNPNHSENSISAAHQQGKSKRRMLNSSNKDHALKSLIRPKKEQQSTAPTDSETKLQNIYVFVALV